MKKFISIILSALVVLSVFALASCEKSKPNVVIYSGMEDYRNEYVLKRLHEQFPDYEITLEYMPTGNLASKVAAEGNTIEADIIVDLDFSYAGILEQYLADVSEYDQTRFCDDMVQSKKYIPMTRNGGAIIVNTKVLEEKGIELPTKYEDLLAENLKGLVSMPDPRSSGTGYMFVKSLVNAWGEDKAFEYFDKLAENILQFTSSGSGPVKALVQGEVAVGLGMTAQAVSSINDGADLKILYFEEGSPSSFYGYAIIDGHKDKAGVKEVFDFFYNTLVDEDKAQFYPEKIYKDKDFEIKNYPTNITYANMEGNTTEEKQRLLEKWTH